MDSIEVKRPQRVGLALRAPWRRGVWTRAEVAEALQARREELRRMLASRGDARGIAEVFLDEVVDDAIRVVVMMRKPVASEEHLMGAFWTTARLLLRQHREGRHTVRVGSRTRVDFEDVFGDRASGDPETEELVMLHERAARAADFLSQLTDLERRVVVATMVDGLGAKAASTSLAVPLNAVKAAERSARAKLDRVAVIASAGRMCSYRAPAIVAHARGAADPRQERAARAHIAACAVCRKEHARLRRRMRSRSFKRDIALVASPGAVIHGITIGSGAGGLLERLARLPTVGGDRVAELIGGAGAAKIAVAGGAALLATATIAVVHPGVSPPRRSPAQPEAGTSSRPSVHARHAPAPKTARLPGNADAARRSRELPTRTALTPPLRAAREFGLTPPPVKENARAQSLTRRSALDTTRPAMQAYREFGQP